MNETMPKPVSRLHDEVFLPISPVSLPALFLETARRRGTATALRHKQFGLWHSISWREYAERVTRLARVLIDWGLEPDEAVAVIGDNRPEWVIADLAIQMASGVTSAIYSTNAPEGVQYVLEHSKVRFVIVEDSLQLDKVLTVRAAYPKLERIIVMDPKDFERAKTSLARQAMGQAGLGLRQSSQSSQSGELEILSFHELLERGADLEAAASHGHDALTSRLAERRGEDPAMIIYTSGTTGAPKGAVLSHKNLLFAAEAFGAVNPMFESDDALSFLPLAHIVERLLSIVLPVRWGYRVNFVENPETVLENLREVRPTVFFAVPRIWEKLQSSVEIRMNRADVTKRLAYRFARMVGLSGGRRRAEDRDEGSDERPDKAKVRPEGLAARFAYLALFRSIKNKLGLDRARFVLSGSAPIAPSVLAFFRSLGVPVREGYGQTEGTAAATMHQGKHGRLGTVGPALPGIEIRIAEDGEILLRGDNVFLGYLGDPAATAAVLRDGWLHTGDMGTLEDGELRITGRKKDLFITSGGKNISPAYIENKLKASNYINDAVLVGDGRSYLTALISLDEENVLEWAQLARISFTTYHDLATHPSVYALIEGEVERVNATLSRVEGVKKFAILPKRFHQEDGEVTPTMKIKRQAVMTQYAELVESLYRA